jgi:hypothetical protein
VSYKMTDVSEVLTAFIIRAMKSQNTVIFIVAVVRTWNLSYEWFLILVFMEQSTSLCLLRNYLFFVPLIFVILVGLWIAFDERSCETRPLHILHVPAKWSSC